MPIPLVVAPRAARSEADDAIFLASSYGLTPDDWQADILGHWLGVRRDGKWSSSTCLLAVARQNGKNAVLEIRELFGMVALGEKFLHTAHEVKTARKAFLRLASFFENPRKHPELAALVKEIRKTNGQEAIVLTNGGSVEFIARSKGSGRGFTVDVLVCDESQDLSDESLAALLPTISASPMGNPQLILTGTPPSGTMNGEVVLRTRRAAIDGKNPRLCLVDYGCEGPLPDVDDRAIWKARNPACGTRLNIETIVDEHSTMDAETFARERLCWWGDPQSLSDRVVPLTSWSACVDAQSQIDRDPVFALDVSPTRSFAAIAAAGLRADDLWHLEVTSRAGVADVRPGLDWVLPRIGQLLAAFPGMQLVVAGGSASEALVPAIEALGVRVTVVRDLGAACGFFYDQVVAKELRHLGQAELNAALLAATRRDVGDNAFVWWRRKSTSDISALYAVTLALWQAEQERNNSMSAINNVW